MLCVIYHNILSETINVGDLNSAFVLVQYLTSYDSFLLNLHTKLL